MVANGLNPISIAKIPNIKPNGTTGIIRGLTSIMPFKKVLKLLFIFQKLFIRSKLYDQYELVFLFQIFHRLHVDECDGNVRIPVLKYH